MTKLFPCNCCGEYPQLKVDYELANPYIYECCGRETHTHRHVIDACCEWNLTYGEEETDD